MVRITVEPLQVRHGLNTALSSCSRCREARMPLGSSAMCPRLREGVKWQSRVMPRRATMRCIEDIVPVIADITPHRSARAGLFAPSTSARESIWPALSLRKGDENHVLQLPDLPSVEGRGDGANAGPIETAGIRYRTPVLWRHGKCRRRDRVHLATGSGHDGVALPGLENAVRQLYLALAS